MYIRSLPDRPYSVAGQHSHGQAVMAAAPNRRSFPVEGFTGYPSPERRLPSGEIVRNVYTVQAQHQGIPIMYEDGIYGYSSRPSSVAGVMDDVARFKMETMERQLANLTGLVQAALINPPPAASTPNSDAKGNHYFFQLMLLPLSLAVFLHN